MFNIENKFLKTKDVNLSKNLLIKEVDEAQKRKARIFMEMGMLLYKKIREDSIEDESFFSMSEELVDLDKLIYINNIKLQCDVDLNEEIECECGYVVKEGSRFCSKCGKNTESIYVKSKVECNVCGFEMDNDSKYCVCCGSKLNNQIYFDEK